MYIRTKDGVYEVEWNSCVEMWCDVKTYKGFILDSMISKVDYKLSENLEELCDLFIDEETKTIFHKHNGYVINWKTNMVYSLKALSESYHSVKGAIYTDEGLIYVAKMDENGDLELI